jgi:hypothetical protein
LAPQLLRGPLKGLLARQVVLIFLAELGPARLHDLHDFVRELPERGNVEVNQVEYQQAAQDIVDEAFLGRPRTHDAQPLLHEQSQLKDDPQQAEDDREPDLEGDLVRSPASHRGHQNDDEGELDREQDGQLSRVTAQEGVQGAEEQHPGRVREGEGQQSRDPGPPAVQDMLGSLFAETVGQEGARQGQPEHQEVEEVVQRSQSLVAEAEAEAPLLLREEEEEEVLQVALEQEGRQEDEGAEGPQELPHPPTLEEPASEHEKEEARDHEEEIEGEELEAGRQKGLAPAFGRQEGRVRVVVLGVNEGVDVLPAGAQPLIDSFGHLDAQQLPLVALHGLHRGEEIVHRGPVVPLVVLVEPQLVEVGHEAQEGQRLPSSGHLVQAGHPCVLHQRRHCGRQQGA